MADGDETVVPPRPRVRDRLCRRGGRGSTWFAWPVTVVVAVGTGLAIAACGAASTSHRTQTHPSTLTAPPLTIRAVLDGTWTVPPWGQGSDCPSGPYTFHNGAAIWQKGDPNTPNGGPPYQSAFHVLTGPGNVYAEDINGDGVKDLLLILECDGHQPIATSVVALTSHPGNTITTLGNVVALPTPARDNRGEVNRINPGSGGLTNLTIDDTYAGIGSTAYQTRSYRLVDGTFRQVSGPNSFPPR